MAYQPPVDIHGIPIGINIDIPEPYKYWNRKPFIVRIEQGDYWFKMRRYSHGTSTACELAVISFLRDRYPESVIQHFSVKSPFAVMDGKKDAKAFDIKQVRANVYPGELVIHTSYNQIKAIAVTNGYFLLVDNTGYIIRLPWQRVATYWNNVAVPRMLRANPPERWPSIDIQFIEWQNARR